MSADPFSEILKLVNADTAVTGGFSAGGAWSIRFPPPDKIKFCAIVKGRCWVWIDGEARPVQAETGDVLLLSAKRSFVLASDLSLTPVDAMALFAGGLNKTAILGEGDDFGQIGGHVRLDPAAGRMLADVLPPWIHIRSSAPQASILRWLLDQLVHERATDRPGSMLSASHLAQLIFVQILRVHVETGAELSSGWLRLVGDRRLAPALQLMHAEPGRAWGLDDLAKASAMSRTSFAAYFKTVAGIAPLSYLTQWRMRLAERALREDNTPVSSISQQLGYTSESAFSNAFKRVTGSAPHHYRRASRVAPLAEGQA